MKALSIVGARPQFIKAAPVSRALREAGHEEFVIHTGQHYDYGMSQIFLDELHCSRPLLNLGVGSGTHGKQTAAMLVGIEEALICEKPDWVLVYGDTNSTLAGALAASKLQVPLAHVEAGLRSFNRTMPEEHNRILTDHCSDLLFCPTETAVKNLEREGIKNGVLLVGDTMYDGVLEWAGIAQRHSHIMEELGLSTKSFLLATMHRPSNTDVPEHLYEILSAFLSSSQTILFPVHPRTQKMISQLASDLDLGSPNCNVRMIPPVGYFDMLVLEQNARLILTDSGGIQKEAFFFQVPCITLRSETEWEETVRAGWNVLTGHSRNNILEAMNDHQWPHDAPPAVFGAGRAAQSIAAALSRSACSSG